MFEAVKLPGSAAARAGSFYSIDVIAITVRDFCVLLVFGIIALSG
jgi:hypothetical protein